MCDTKRTVERESAPPLPTSGQVLGALAGRLSIKTPGLSPRTVRRFFSGRLDDMVKESTRGKIIEAISNALDELVGAPHWNEDKSAPGSYSWASVLDWHALNWDRMRAFLLPRMMRIYPRNHSVVWRTYIRLVAIDLALRTAALVHLTSTSPKTLDFLEWVSVDRRGSYLNNMRSKAGLSLYDFTDFVGVSPTTVEAWLYQGKRPGDDNLANIAKAFSQESGESETELVLRELRRLYLTSDIAGLLEEFIGTEAVSEMLGRLRRYSSQVYQVIKDGTLVRFRIDDLIDIVRFGADSRLSDPLLAVIRTFETDDEWKEDLLAADSDWVGRVLAVNLKVHQTEEEELIRDTDGGILKKWDVSNPVAFAHYQRSMELKQQGRIHEVLSEVAKAAELDPLDPANYFTLGSVKGAIGAHQGDRALVREALDACWMAVKLDPDWILPWTEIGWLLLRTGRAEEAVEHLKGVRPECGPLDSRYYDALGLALYELGELTEALATFQSSLELNPNDPRIAFAAAATALQAGDNIKFNRYRKMARHVGVSDRWAQALELMKEIKAAFPTLDITKGPDHEIVAPDGGIAGNLGGPEVHFASAKSHFLKGDDGRAISDLDKAISLDLGSAPGYLLRGIVYGYMKKYDRVIDDMSHAIRLNPRESMAYYYRGMAYGELNALDRAISDMTQVIRLSPDHVDAYRVRGDCHRYGEEYDLAIVDYDTALGLDPEDGSSFLGRGAAYRTKLEFRKAIADYDEAVRLDPENPLTYRFRGEANLGDGNYERATTDFDIALRIDPMDAIAFRSRGDARLFSGYFDLAMEDFSAALEHDPNSASAYYGRSLVHMVNGNNDEAETDRRRALELGYDEAT